ncbi:hypothetical protein TL18_02760 [Methanobrevibacter sp. YE315]|uniref:hypothetical protein n=1 Tax=Methanobrevibacter sp. YE315 TaxID=1609968 RepID=UPI000764F232|nr:hypothetical protein [Methanobrevibacter sp. YE315]AMD17038.1 hypothetical protein TL18_02760 [Methanobrevibacter sp. YE315]
MTDYCLFTITHPEAKRIYIRGIADITVPIDEYDKIIEFYEGNQLKKSLPSNPYNEGSKDYKLFEELLSAIKSNFEDIGDDLVFATQWDSKFHEWSNHSATEEYIIDMEKVTV